MDDVSSKRSEYEQGWLYTRVVPPLLTLVRIPFFIRKVLVTLFLVTLVRTMMAFEVYFVYKPMIATLECLERVLQFATNIVKERLRQEGVVDCLARTPKKVTFKVQ